MVELPLVAEGYSVEPTRIVASASEYDRRARVRRAALIALPLLGLALVSVPIPGWHLVAVPGFLIAAVVLGRRRLRQALEIDSLAGPCPACRAEQRYEVPAFVELPLTLPCPACGEFLKLSELR